MKFWANFGAAILIVTIIAGSLWAYFYLKNSIRDDNPDEDKVKKKNKISVWKKLLINKKTYRKTVLVNMPVVSYKIGRNTWDGGSLTKKITTIGSSPDCDICIDDPTVSELQAKIIMKIRKFDIENKGARYFVIKNCALENPIQYCKPVTEKEFELKDIVRTMTLEEHKNIFLFGTTKVCIKLPERKNITLDSSFDDSKVHDKSEKNERDRRKDKKTADIKNTADESSVIERSGEESQVRF